MNKPDRYYSRWKYIRTRWELYLMLLLPVAFVFVFNYLPMGGLIIAFKDFKLRQGIWGSPWASNFGFNQFIRFFSNYNFYSSLRNTLVLSIYSLLITIPSSVLLATGLNYVYKTVFKKAVQMISYFPYFISSIVIASIINMIFNTRTGVLGRLYMALTNSNILADANMFSHLYVWSGVWQGVGFGAIIYMAAFSNVDPQLHEAAIIDGATVLRRIWSIDLPSIIPMVTIMFILNMGSVLNIGYEKVLAMQNQNNLSTSEVISTYAYKVSLAANIPDFSYGTAIGFFQSIVGLVLILITNKLANKLTGTGFW